VGEVREPVSDREKNTRVKRSEGNMTGLSQEPTRQTDREEHGPVHEDDEEYENAQTMLEDGIDPWTGEPIEDASEEDMEWEEE
jgi:hypothetical protein